MFDDCECEMCGAPATTTIRGVQLCGSETCDPYAEEEPEPPHWPIEVPSGLMGLDEHAA